MTVSLTESRMREAAFWRNEYVAHPEEGTTLEDMKSDSYWAHVSKKLRPWDKVEVHAEDGSFMATFIVRDSGRNWAKVEMISSHVFAGGSVSEHTPGDPGYFAKWSGPHTKWRVIRKSDNQIMREGFALQGDADQWIKEHVKSLAK